MATIGTGTQVILAPTGLGHLWLEQDVATVAARKAVRSLVATVGKRNSEHFLFENAEDPSIFGLNAGNAAKVTLVGGAGVAPEPFAPLPASPPMRVAVVARMTAPKGISPVVEAVRRLRQTGRDIRLDLYGMPDFANRRSIPEATLRNWGNVEGITWHGHTNDVRKVWSTTHVAALLSWREGLPRGLVEAMAFGRPIVTTDVAGCRELVRDGIEGFLVPVESVDATAMSLQALYDDAALREAMGRASKARFEERFTEVAVQAVITDLYQRRLRRLPST